MALRTPLPSLGVWARSLRLPRASERMGKAHQALEEVKSMLWARCSSCEEFFENSLLIPDPNHPCGKDECPLCGAQGSISCCLSEKVMIAFLQWERGLQQTRPALDAEEAVEGTGK